MKDQQLPFYAACPLWYWPWLWLQFRRLDKWMARRLASGEHGEVVLHLGSRGTLRMSFVSDNLNKHTPISYTTLTLESLTWGHTPEWLYTVTRALTCKRREGEASNTFTNQTEIADALIPIP